MMRRTQISFDPETLTKAKRKAADLGVSLAEYLRRLVSRDLDEDVPSEFDVKRLFALGRSGGSDVARHKDDYVSDAIETR